MTIKKSFSLPEVEIFFNIFYVVVNRKFMNVGILREIVFNGYCRFYGLKSVTKRLR